MNLVSLNSQAIELEMGSYATVHAVGYSGSRVMYNDIGDGRTTINPMIRLKGSNGLSVMYLQDSIGDFNFGATWGFQKPLNDRVKWGIETGFYLINYQEWEERKFTHFWIPVGNKGITLVAGPTLEIELLKVNNVSIKNNTFISVGGFIMSGLILGIRF